MKSINNEYVDKFNSVVELLSDRDVFITYLLNFSKNAEQVIDKLSLEPLLKDSDREAFVMYKKGLIGLNTKDTSISMAGKYISKLIGSYSGRVETILTELKEYELSTIVENFSTLENFLDKDIVNINYVVLKDDLALREYAEHKITELLSRTFHISGTKDEYMNFINSIISTINDNSFTDVHNGLSKAIKLADINTTEVKTLSKLILSNSGKVMDSDISINKIKPCSIIDIESDNISNYIVLKEDKVLDTSLSDSVIKLYDEIILKENDINSIINKDISPIFQPITMANSELSIVIKKYLEDEYTTEEFIVLFKEFNNLFISNYNDLTVILEEAHTDNKNINRLTYMLYLLKALVEKIVIESTIKG